MATLNPGEEKLIIRISVSINDTDYGADLYYASAKYVMNEDTPRPTSMTTAMDIAEMLHAGFENSNVKPIVKRIEEAWTYRRSPRSDDLGAPGPDGP